MQGKQIFIHCGYTRTGTTFLQQKVFPFFNGVDCLIRPQAIYEYSIYEEEKLKKQSNEEISNFPNDKVLISHEGLLAFNPISQIDALWRIFPEATILITLRNQYDRIVGQYMKRVMLGVTALDFMDDISLMKYKYISEGSYETHLRSLHNRFQGRIHVALYEEMFGLPGGLNECVKKISEILVTKYIGKGFDSAERINKSNTSLFDREGRFLCGETVNNKTGSHDGTVRERCRQKAFSFLSRAFCCQNERIVNELKIPLTEKYFVV